MAACTIFDVADAFLRAFDQDLVRLMFVATVARMAGKIAANMTGGAARVVRPGQRQKTRMVEGGGFPALLCMALRAVVAELGVEGGCWCSVARSALAPDVEP
jgi:hypothetical protein